MISFRELVSGRKARQAAKAAGSINSRAASHVGTPPAGPGGQRTTPQASDAVRGQAGAGTSKGSRSGNNPDRWRHFADACTQSAAAAVETESETPAREDFRQVSAAHGGRAAAIRQGIRQGFRSDEAVAAEGAEAAKVARQALSAHAKATAPAGSTAAAKPGGVPYSRVTGLCGKAVETKPSAAARAGADAVQTARRLGVIK